MEEIQMDANDVIQSLLTRISQDAETIAKLTALNKALVNKINALSQQNTDK